MGINLPIYALNSQAVFLDEVYALPDKDRQFNSIMTFASWGRQLQRDPKHKRVLSLSLKYRVEQIMIEIKTITTEAHTAYLYWIESIYRRYFSFKNPYSFTQVSSQSLLWTTEVHTAYIELRAYAGDIFLLKIHIPSLKSKSSVKSIIHCIRLYVRQALTLSF